MQHPWAYHCLMNCYGLLSALLESVYGSHSLVAVAWAAEALVALALVALTVASVSLYVVGRMAHGVVAQLRDSLYATMQNVVFFSTA